MKFAKDARRPRHAALERQSPDPADLARKARPSFSSCNGFATPSMPSATKGESLAAKPAAKLRSRTREPPRRRRRHANAGEKKPDGQGHRRLPSAGRPEGTASRPEPEGRATRRKRRTPPLRLSVRAQRLPPTIPSAMDLTHAAHRKYPGLCVCITSLRLDGAPSAPARVARPENAVGKLVATCPHRLDGGRQFHRPRRRHTATGRWRPYASRRMVVRARVARGASHSLIAGILGGGWFVFMPLAGAVVVPGNLVVQSNVKTIQHPTGGVVAEIKVQNGTRSAPATSWSGSMRPRRRRACRW